MSIVRCFAFVAFVVVIICIGRGTARAHDDEFWTDFVVMKGSVWPVMASGPAEPTFLPG